MTMSLFKSGRVLVLYDKKVVLVWDINGFLIRLCGLYRCEYEGVQ